MYASDSEVNSVPARWRWHYHKLLDMREHLLEARERGLEQAEEMYTWRATDPADSATDEFDRDLALSLMSSEVEALYEIDAALERIRDGSYGICEVSGAFIPEERLRALPWTRYCASVAEEPSGPKLSPLQPLQPCISLNEEINDLNE